MSAGPGGTIRQNNVRVITAAILVSVLCTAGIPADADDAKTQAPPAADSGKNESPERTQVRQEMQLRSSQIKVALVEEPDREVRLIDTPLLTYSDAPRHVTGATLWAWESKKGGRPIAACKIERYDPSRKPRTGWHYCIHSLSSEKIHAEWPFGREWSATRSGISFGAVPDAPKAADTPKARLRQMKELSRRFTAFFDFNKDQTEELRLLVQPVHRYADVDAGLIDGTMFIATFHGTNPTALFLIELQEERGRPTWKFAVAGMTDGAVVVKCDGKEVWSKPTTFGPGKNLETWTYFLDPD